MTIGRAYRATGADRPYGDPRRAHGVAMEGYFWRFSDPQSGRVVVALCGVNRTADVPWATVCLAGHPGGFVRTADVRVAGADSTRLGVWAGNDTFRADADRVRVDLGSDARLDVSIRDAHPWPRRAFGGLGAAHALPALGQYWHPHLLGGRAGGTATIAGARLDLDGFQVYGEKNWGTAGFPGRWWWGQAQGFQRPDACVAFAGGDVRVGPVTLPATALVVRLGDDLLRLGHPLTSPVTAEAGDGRWRLRGRSARWSVAVDASATPRDAYVLPVPLPAAGRSVPGALEHLAGVLRVTVRRRGRVVFADESRLAGLEDGGVDRVDAELARR
ncbi:MAG: tocopherol cyclase family protein [Solirubrobacteraceae bacterium]